MKRVIKKPARANKSASKAKRVRTAKKVFRGGKVI
jgi:hypothetical protein